MLKEDILKFVNGTSQIAIHLLVIKMFHHSLSKMSKGEGSSNALIVVEKIVPNYKQA